MKISDSKYRKSLILFGLIIGTLPVILLGIFSYFKASSIIQKKVNDTNLQVLQQTEMRVEEVLKSIQYYYSAMANSPAVTDYLDKKLTYIDYDSVIDIQRRLGGMQAVQASVRNAIFANIENDWVIGTQGMSAVEEKFNKQQLNKVMKDSRNSFWVCSREDANIYAEAQSVEYNPINNISLVIKVPLNSNEPQGALAINLQGYEFMKSATQSERLDEMIILDDNNEIILRDGKDILDDKSRDNFIEEFKKNVNQYGFYNSTIKNKKVGVSYRKSRYNDWTYVSIYDIGDITKDSKAIGFVTLIICVVIIICVLIVSIFGSSIFYKPIKNIYELIVKNSDIKLSSKGNDEVTYIGEGINNLFIKQNQMVEQMEVQQLQLEELFLKKLVSGELDESEINIKLKALGYKEFWRWISVFSIQMDSLDGTKYDENDIDLLLFSISNIICDIISEDKRFKPTLINRAQVLLVLGEQDKYYEEFKNFTYNYASKIQEIVKQVLNVGVSIGISRPYEKLKDTEIAYKESREALMCSIRFGEETILHYDEAQPDGFIKQTYPKNIEDELINAINHGEVEKAEELLNELINSILNKELSLFEYQIYLMRLFINIIGVLQDSGESINILIDNKDGLLDELYSLRNSSQIKKWFKVSIVYPVIRCLEERRGIQYKNILEQVINMIHEEFDKDITLESCAARLNYQPNYIWRVLKKEMNTTFSDYLAKYRLSIAKKWLEETSIPVGEIAEKLRYNNSQNFIRYFKKLEEITPGQYRDKFKNSANTLRAKK